MSDLGPEARSILDRGRDGDTPTAADRARIRRSLSRALAAGGALGAAGGAAAEGAAAAGKAASWLTFAKIAGGLLFVGALGAGIWYSRPLPPGQAASQSAKAEASRPPATPQSPTLPGPSDSPSPAATAADSSPPVAPAPPSAPPSAVTAPQATSARAPAASAAAEDTLEEETRRLGEAHSALKSGDPEKALRLLDDASSSHPGGQLGPERAVARVLSLCKLGRTAEARAAAASFLSQNPDSPLADRVRGACP